MRSLLPVLLVFASSVAPHHAAAVPHIQVSFSQANWEFSIAPNLFEMPSDVTGFTWSIDGIQVVNNFAPDGAFQFPLTIFDGTGFIEIPGTLNGLQSFGGLLPPPNDWAHHWYATPGLHQITGAYQVAANANLLPLLGTSYTIGPTVGPRPGTAAEVSEAVPTFALLLLSAALMWVARRRSEPANWAG